MSQNSIGKNYIYNVAYQLLSIITPIILTPYISRVLGADGVGIISYFEAISSYFVLFAILGTNIYGQREISAARNDRYRVTEIFWNTEIVSIISSCIVMILYIIMGYFQNIDMLLVYGIYSLNIIAVIFDITWFFQGLENFPLIAIRNSIIKVIGVVFILYFVDSKNDVYLYVLILCCANLLGNILLWKRIGKYIDGIKSVDIIPKKYICEIIPLFLPTIVISLYIVLDKIMLGYFMNDFIQNGYYEQSMKIVRLSTTIIISIGSVMMSRLSYFYANKEYNTIIEYIYISCRFVWMISLPLVLGIIVIADNFLPWFLGNEFIDSIDILIVASGIIIFVGMSNVIGIQYLIPLKRQNELTISVLLGAFINIILNVLFIPRYMAFGAALSSVIAECSVTMFQFYLVSREIALFRVLKYSYNYLIASSCMYIALYIISCNMQAIPINTFVLIILGGIFYLVMLIILKDDFAMEILKRTMMSGEKFCSNHMKILRQSI